MTFLRFPTRLRLRNGRAGAFLLAALLSLPSAQAADLNIKIAKRGKSTPVQQLNQEGVKALDKNDIARAKRAFYHAYLLDPDDPFTLNNLGYVAELDGEIDKAQKFYDLAAANPSGAVVALSSSPDLKGKEVSQVAGNAVSASMQVNRLNVAAMGLMMKDRAPEAELVLRKALLLDSKSPFTLNNLGYAMEKEGELEQAQRYYDLAARSGSQDRVVVALNRNWRGRSISEVAGINAEAVRRELSTESSSEAKVTRLNLRGVSALNRNQIAQARQLFQQAYQIDPGNAFSLNNMGYVSEVEGDRETADYYYAKAREANRSSARVALATRKSLEGQKLASVASQNGQFVQAAEETRLAALRAQGGPPPPLRTRDQAFVREPATPPVPEPEIPVRVVAEDNPPPLPPRAMAAPAVARNQPAPDQPAPVQPRPVSPPAAASPAPERSATVATAAPPTRVPPIYVRPSPLAAAPVRPARVASAPIASAPAPSTSAMSTPVQLPPAVAQPVLPTTMLSPQDEAPLLPVIPDEAPAPAR